MLTWCTMPVPGGTTLNSSNAVWPQRRKRYRSWLRVGGAEDVGDDGVVDHELGRRQRVDLRGVAAEGQHRLAHRGEVDDTGHSGEVLHDHAGRGELDLGVRLGLRVPAREGADVRVGDVRPVLGAQQVLQQHLERVGQILGARNGVEPEDLVGFFADAQVGARSEAVGGHRGSPLVWRTTYLDIKIPHGAEVSELGRPAFPDDPHAAPRGRRDVPLPARGTVHRGRCRARGALPIHASVAPSLRIGSVGRGPWPPGSSRELTYRRRTR